MSNFVRDSCLFVILLLLNRTRLQPNMITSKIRIKTDGRWKWNLGLLRPEPLYLTLGLIAWLSVASAENWPAWRGPRGDGTSKETKVPIHWTARRQSDAGLNVFWKTEIPGDGHASPIVWGDRIFIVSAR